MGLAKRTALVGLGGAAAGSVGALLALYLHGVFRQRVVLDVKNAPRTRDERFPWVLEGLSGSLDTTCRPTGFWVEADAIFGARLDAIRQATDIIQLETFYMTPGKRADQFSEALCERARAGVTVLFLVDHYGAKDMPEAYWRTMREAGVTVRFFRTFNWRSPLDYLSRTHRKLLVIDGREAYIGGAGISDDWDGRPEIGDRAPWRDFELRYEGRAVSVLAGVFMQDWSSEGGELDLSPDIFREETDEQAMPAYVTTGSFQLQATPMHMLFELSILAATQRVWIASPYFLPEPGTRQALIEACRRGVDVRILTMGQANDRPFVYQAAKEAYHELLQAGIDIYEYRPAMMHAKAILVDERWISTGSANFDPLSFFNNNELNISHGDPSVENELEQFFLESFDQSDHVTLEAWERRTWKDKAIGKAMMTFRSLF